MKVVGRPTNTPTNPALFGGATPEQVAAAVAAYLEENPVNKPTDAQIASAVEAYLKKTPVGVPAGGESGQYLRKKSDADGDAEWADLEIPKEYGLISYDQDRTITIT